MNLINRKMHTCRGRALLGSAVIALLSTSHAFANETLAGQNAPIATNPQTPVLMAQVSVDETEVLQTGSDAADDDFDEIDTLIVTGSRLRNNAFTSDLPVQIISAEESLDLGLNSTAELIKRSSLLSGSPQNDGTQSLTAIGGSSVNGGNGTNTLSLRGLGEQRTLVLLDGRRLSPSGNRGGLSAPNISVIPSSILSGVEILKDGASSIYGSDAIAGVINNITVKDSDVSSVSVFGSLPEAGGAESFQVNGRFSKTYDRGNFNIAAQYDREERLRTGQRDFTDCRDPRYSDPDTGRIVDAVDPATGETICQSFGSNNRFFIFRFDNVNAGPFNDVNSLNNRFAGLYIPDPDGTIIGPGQDELRPILPEFARVGVFRLGVTDPNVNFGPNSGDFALSTQSLALLPQTSPFIQNGNAQNPEERISLFANGSYELTDTVEAYGQVLFNRTETQVNSFRFLFANLDAFSPVNTVGQRLRDATGNDLSGSVGFNIIRPYFSDNRTDYINAVAGLKGDFGSSFKPLDGWRWDIYGQFGRSDADYTSNFTRQDRLELVTGRGNPSACDPAASLDAVTGQPNTANVCDGIRIPFLSPRILRDGVFTAEEENFLEGVETGNTRYDQLVLEGFMDGTLFKMPAGDVSAGFGFHLQKDKINDTPGPNALAGNNHNFSSASPTVGDTSLVEGFFELGVPLLADSPLAKRLHLTGSGRVTKQSEFDKAEFTYKIGGAWDPIDDIRFRASYGTSYRAPALFELFQGGTVSFGSSDPCANLQNSNRPAEELAILSSNCALFGIGDDLLPTINLETQNTGNDSGTLRAETSTAFNAGVVIQPSVLGVDLSFAADYFEIDINDQIGTIGSFQILERCFTNEAFATLADLQNDKFCALLGPRNALNELEFVVNGQINIAKQSSRGIDFQARAGTDIGGYDVNFNSQVTYQLEDFIDEDEATSDVNTEINRLGLGLRPRMSGTANLSARKGNWGVFWGVNVVGASDQRRRLDELPNNGFNEGEIARQIFTEPYRFLGPLSQDTRVEFYHRHTGSVSYDMPEKGMTLRAGVSNVFDADPPTVGFGVRRVGTAAGGYELKGRSFFARATKRF